MIKAGQQYRILVDNEWLGILSGVVVDIDSVFDLHGRFRYDGSTYFITENDIECKTIELLEENV